MKDVLVYNKKEKTEDELLRDAYERVLTESGIQVWMKDTDIRYIFANELMKIADGIPGVDVTGKKDEELYDKYRCSMFTSLDREVIKSKDTVASTYILPSGSFEEVTKIPVCNEEGEVIAVLGYAKDVTADRLLSEHTRRTSEAEQRFRKIFDTVPVGLVIFEYKSSNPVLMNEQCENIIRMSKAKLKTTSWQNCIVDPEVMRFLDAKTEEIAAGDLDHFETEVEITRGDGERAWLKLIVSDYSVGIAEGKNFLCAIWDITEEKTMKAKLERFSSTDGMTELYSRSWFVRYLDSDDVELEYPFAVVMGDVNGLKICNDAFGHFEGDKLIKAGAAAFLHAAEKHEKSYAVRLGGDEFLAVIYGVEEKDLPALEEEIRKEVSDQSPEYMEYSVSVGSVFVKKDGFPDLESAIMAAESKMYAFKLHESRDLGDKLVERVRKLLLQDPLEASHMQNVAHYSKELCKKLNLGEEATKTVAEAAKLHDIGISLSNSKRPYPGAPIRMDTPVGNTIIRKHSEIGYRLLKFSKSYAPLADIVLCHHEHVDGLGFPAGLQGENIPMESKIIAVADSYDVMTNPRFGDGKNERDAVAALREKEGKRLDPEYTEIFIKEVLGLE